MLRMQLPVCGVAYDLDTDKIDGFTRGRVPEGGYDANGKIRSRCFEYPIPTLSQTAVGSMEV